MARRAYLSFAAIVAVLVFTTLAFTQRTDAPKATSAAAPMASSATEAPKTATSYSDFRRLFIDVAKVVRPSVVAVTSVSTVDTRAEEGNPFEFFFRGPQGGRGGKQKRQGMGSGVVVSRDGLVLTNNHVVADADELTVVLHDDRELAAELVGADPKSDIAVIRIKDKAAAAQLTPVQLGDSARLEVGEWVMAIGSPFGLKQTVSAGIVSAVGRGNVGIVDYEDFVQTDAAINPGNSGGPLVNLDGRVIGINTAIASRTGGNNGVGFAIPINMARAAMDQLVDHGSVTRGYIGVFIGNLDAELAKSFGFQGKAGVLVQDVAPDGPGAKAGLASGDIVMERDGKAVSDVAAFRNGIAAARPGTKVKLAVWRSGKRVDLAVTLGELPDDAKAAAPRKQGGKAPSNTESESRIGLRLDDISPALRERFSLNDTKGALIVGVAQGSAAEEAGLRPGDVITQIGNEAVASAADAQRVVQKADKKAPLRLRVVRDGRGSFTLVRPQN
jgi:serine protease Do